MREGLLDSVRETATTKKNGTLGGNVPLGAATFCGLEALRVGERVCSTRDRRYDRR
ncbi:MAG: hypothetical protein Q4D38_08280 [Planctomycetia bacterium]|nr:hypothetical protein [Planctomycetia bacterium]